MRRGGSFRSRLARLTLAYALALQALLSAWPVAATAHSFDPSLTLCRTIASDEPADKTAPVSHCVAMCLAGGCAAGDPPVMSSAATEYAPLPAAILSSDDRLTIVVSAPFTRLFARGPPQFV